MGIGLAQHVARVDGDAVPGQAFHVGHGGLLVLRGMVGLALLENRKYSRRGRVLTLARADRGPADEIAVAIDL